MNKLLFDAFAGDPIMALPNSQFGELKAHLVQRGFFTVELSGDQISTKRELFSALANSFKFPSYFGNNWDALEECLLDLEWIPARGYALLFSNAERFARLRPADYGTFVDIVRATARAHEQNNVKFVLVTGKDP